jgi:preprotein translocase subunit SecG
MLTWPRIPATFKSCVFNPLLRDEQPVFALLLTLLILDGILLIVIVLMQAGKGGGLAAMGGGAAGTDTLMGGGRQAAGILTKATWTTGAIFLALSVVLSVLSSRAQDTRPLLEQELQRTAPMAPQPILPGPGEGAAPGEAVPGLPGTQDDGDS